MVTPSQDLKAYLTVLYDAIAKHGCPEVLVSDSGAIFLANAAQAIYKDLGIEKKQIARRQPWQNLIETHFSIQHRLADYHFARATTWKALQAAHENWVLDYNYQDHWAHRERTDRRHSPAQVLGWLRGNLVTTHELTKIFRTHANRDSRSVDKYGYVKFRHWRIYGERGLFRRKAGVWLWGENLSIEFSNQTLAEYSVRYGPVIPLQIGEITGRQLHESIYASPQGDLWDQGEMEWHLAYPDPEPYPVPNRSKATTSSALGSQLIFLFEFESEGADRVACYPAVSAASS